MYNNDSRMHLQFEFEVWDHNNMELYSIKEPWVWSPQPPSTAHSSLLLHLLIRT